MKTPKRCRRIDVFCNGRAVLCRGDCLAVLPTLPAGSVDAIVTDPPYHLTTGKKGGTGPASDNPHSPAGRARATTGFMGKTWDGGDVAHDPAVWREALRVAKPGAHLLAFGGTRTFHRLACAIEDAGWEIRDTVMWVYGSGFPKSLDVSKAIDKEAGAERKVIGHSRGVAVADNQGFGGIARGGVGIIQKACDVPVTAPATDAARRWSGWGTALKPAWEPIIVARKPLEGTVAQNVQRHGTGGLNIDGCRVDGPGWSKTDGESGAAFRTGKFIGVVGRGEPTLQFGMRRSVRGRWPANLIHDGSEEVVGLFPKIGPSFRSGDRGNHTKMPGSVRIGDGKTGLGFRDSGSAARFFYCAKASKQDRDGGCEGVKRKGNDWYRETSGLNKGPNERRGGETVRLLPRNHHPTVKPTALMRYLCRLVTPPGGIVLDPFAGSGSTGKAAALEGFRFIGIEIDPEYLAIAARRLRAARGEAAR